jgi:phage recombination protein Bet
MGKIADDALDVLLSGKNKNLLNLIPKGQSPKLYLELIKNQVMGSDRNGQARPDEDLLLFLYVCKRTGLDPLTKQIYAVYRWDTKIGREKMVIQTGIDGMRLVAERTGTYAGQDDINYLPVDESTKYPVRATATVYKILKGVKVATPASARWTEYVQKDKNGQPSTMWDRMPYLMLGKCAEALALRKAFPNELAGIYADEEMTQANPTADLPVPERQTNGKEPPVEIGTQTPPNTPKTAETVKTDITTVPDMGKLRGGLKI